MINNFNTAKLIFMGIVRSICKYLMIVMILLFLFSSIIQTSTYIQIYLSGDFSINNADNITVDGTDYSRVSGKAYLSSFGTVKTEQGWNTHWEEEAWGEIGSKNHNVEEMEEGPYEFDPFSDAGWQKATYEDDDEWSTQTRYHKDEIRTLYDNGWVALDFQPSPSNKSQGDFYVGFRGNPEASQKNIYKEDLSVQWRGGLGLFMVVIPSAETYVSNVFIRDLGSAGGGDTGIITYKSPVTTPECVSGICTLDFNNDFLSSCSDTWDSYEGFLKVDSSYWTYDWSYKTYQKPSAVYEGTSSGCQTMSSFGYTIPINDDKMMSMYSLSPTSTFKSKECRSCYDSETSKTTALWNNLFGEIASKDSDMYAAITETSDCSNVDSSVFVFCDKDFPKLVDTSSSDDGYTYDLPNNMDRSRAPVAFAFSFAYFGGDTWTNLPLTEYAGNFLIVTDERDEEFQIEVQFSQIGVGIYANSNAGNVLALTSTLSGKSINADSPLWVYSPTDTETVTVGESASYCIEDILLEQKQSVSSGDDMEISITTSNILRDDHTDHRTPEYHLTVSSSDVPTQDFKRNPLALGNTNISDLVMNANYTFDLTVFTPVFEIWTTANSYVETLEIGGYLNINDIDYPTDESQLFNINDLTLYSQDTDTNGFSCAFPEHLQELFIAPKSEELRYLNSLGSTNANIFTESPDGYYRAYTQSDIQFSLDQVRVFAQPLSTSNSKVNAEILPFPSVTTTSYIGSYLSGRVTSDPYETNLNYENGIIFNNDNPIFSIQPQESITFNINRKLERLGIYGEESGYFGLYSGEDNDTNAVDGTDISYEGLNMEVDPTLVGIYDIPNADDTSKQFSATSSSQSTINFELKYNPGVGEMFDYSFNMDSVEENIVLFIDFIPYIVTFNISIIDQSSTADSVTTNISKDEGGTIYISGDSYDYTNDFSKATYNESFDIEVTIGVDDSTPYTRNDYYIFDVIEYYYPDIGENTSTSYLSSAYSTLSSMDNAFVWFNSYSSTNITNDTGIQFLLEKYKIVELTFNEFGTVEHDFSGLAQIGDTSETSQLYSVDSGTESFILKPNIILVSATETANVGFRRYDNLNLVLLPEPGYYVQSVIYTIDVDENGSFDDDVDVTSNILSTLPEFTDAVSAKSLEIFTISRNVKIDVNFEVKPGIRSFFLSPIY